MSILSTFTIGLLLFFSLNVHAGKKFVTCNMLQIMTIENAISMAQDELPLLIQKIQAEMKNNQELTKNELKQLKKASEVLSCTLKKIPTVQKYSCKEGEYFAGRVKRMPVINITSAGMALGSLFFSGDSIYQSETIIHEVSHKCGSKDGDTYFVENEIAPNTAADSDWGNLAPVYDWWYEMGVCIPGKNC